MSQKEIIPIDLIEPFWERQPGESTTWFRRFCRVRNQIGQRSLLSAYRAETEERGGKKRLPRSIPGSWEDARIRFRWDERAEAWDLDRQKRDDQIWEERWSALRESAWEISELMLQQSRIMAQMPLVEQTISAGLGGSATTIKATDWSQFRYATDLARTGYDLGAKAIGDPNSAVNLLTKLGFEVRDPTTAKVSSQDQQENLDWWASSPTLNLDPGSPDPANQNDQQKID